MKQIPSFSGIQQNGEEIQFNFPRDRKLVVFFYPKNNTRVCTAEVCHFRDVQAEFEALNCDIVGISNDNPASHVKFSSKHDLQYPLIQNKGHHKLFGVKNYLGLMTARVTFLLDEEGKVIHEVSAMLKDNVHADEMLDILKS